jgi:hypothetical protein
MRNACGCKTAASRHPSASAQRDPQRQQQKGARAQVGQKIARRDASTGTAPNQKQKAGLEGDPDQNKVNEVSARKNFSHSGQSHGDALQAT